MILLNYSISIVDEGESISYFSPCLPYYIRFQTLKADICLNQIGNQIISFLYNQIRTASAMKNDLHDKIHNNFFLYTIKL